MGFFPVRCDFYFEWHIVPQFPSDLRDTFEALKSFILRAFAQLDTLQLTARNKNSFEN